MSKSERDSLLYPYKDGLWKALKDPQYIKDKAEMFNKHGNGWWWGNGWWNGNHISSMERMSRYREAKEN